MKSKINAFITRIKRKLNTPKPVNCTLLEQRIEELEQKINKRQTNFKQSVRNEVRIYLEELKNK